MNPYESPRPVSEKTRWGTLGYLAILAASCGICFYAGMRVGYSGGYEDGVIHGSINARREGIPLNPGPTTYRPDNAPSP